MWTLETGLVAVRAIEEALKKHNAHAALGGSVLHFGKSEKDLDVFIYPHNTAEPFHNDHILEAVHDIGVRSIYDRPRVHNENKADQKEVWVCEDTSGKRIDFFFVR